MYLFTKFGVSSSSGLDCVFYTTMGLEAILDPRWRLFFIVLLYCRDLLLKVHIHIKFKFYSSNGVENYFWAAIMNTMWRLLQNLVIFS